MPVSKNRKSHKNKVAIRNQNIKAGKKRQEAVINSYINSILAKQAQEKVIADGLKHTPMTEADIIAEGITPPVDDEIQEPKITEVEFTEVKENESL